MKGSLKARLRISTASLDVKAVNAGMGRIWTPHKDFTGDDMPRGVFREPQCEQCELVLTGDVLACRFCATGASKTDVAKARAAKVAAMAEGGCPPHCCCECVNCCDCGQRK